jgi:hypothetical protein
VPSAGWPVGCGSGSTVGCVVAVAVGFTATAVPLALAVAVGALPEVGGSGTSVVALAAGGWVAVGWAGALALTGAVCPGIS